MIAPTGQYMCMYKVNVFICYKKLLSVTEDGRITTQKNTEAGVLHDILQRDPRYDPWVDSAQLLAGMAWETTIYRRLMSSDVVLVLIGPGTSQSEWVKREVALARALGVSIVPVVFDLSGRALVDELRELELTDLQYHLTTNIASHRAEALLAELQQPLQAAYTNTRNQQRSALQGLLERQQRPTLKAKDVEQLASFRLSPTDDSTILHLSSGDIAELKSVDVIVNSENNYMQMARSFEGRSVSSILRLKGSYFLRNRYYDVIQRELDLQVEVDGRPTSPGQVFATSAGGPHSLLAIGSRVRAILHVAAVAVDSGRIMPYHRPYQIEGAVRNSLATLTDLNRRNGVFSPEGTDQRLDQERLAEAGRGQLRSIAFPLLGTGQGGAAVPEVIEAMSNGLTAFFRDDSRDEFARTIQSVYICAYTDEDVVTARTALGQVFQAVT